MYEAEQIKFEFNISSINLYINKDDKNSVVCPLCVAESIHICKRRESFLINGMILQRLKIPFNPIFECKYHNLSIKCNCNTNYLMK